MEKVRCVLSVHQVTVIERKLFISKVRQKDEAVWYKTFWKPPQVFSMSFMISMIYSLDVTRISFRFNIILEPTMVGNRGHCPKFFQIKFCSYSALLVSNLGRVPWHSYSKTAGRRAFHRTLALAQSEFPFDRDCRSCPPRSSIKCA